MSDRVLIVGAVALVCATVILMLALVVHDAKHPCTRTEIRTRHEDAFPGIALALLLNQPVFYAFQSSGGDVEYRVCVEWRP